MPVQSRSRVDANDITGTTSECALKEIDYVIVPHSDLGLGGPVTDIGGSTGLVFIIEEVFVHRVPMLLDPDSAILVIAFDKADFVVLYADSSRINPGSHGVIPVDPLGALEDDAVDIV